MTTKKKIILTILLAVLVGVGVYCIVVDITDIILFVDNSSAYKELGKNVYLYHLIKYIFYSIIFISTTLIGGLLIFKIWFDKETKQQIKYSYEDYKNAKNKKRLKKLEKKKILIDNQISNLNK